MTLTGKVAIVTGGNSGIGKSVALGLAAAGANIVIDYVDQRAGDRGPRAADRRPRRQGDRRRRRRQQGRGPRAARRRRRQAFGRLDIMVNNAGIETRTSILDTTEAQYDRVLDDQPQERLLRHPDRRQADDRPGRRRADHQHDVGARGLADARQHAVLPVEGRHAHADPHRRRRAGQARRLVVGVGPGAVDTPINASTMADPVLLQKLDAAIPIGRMAEPEEIASVVVFLAGDGASYLAATTIFADGGIMHSSPGL